MYARLHSNPYKNVINELPLFIVKYFTVNKTPPAPSFARNPHPREFEGDSRN